MTVLEACVSCKSAYLSSFMSWALLGLPWACFCKITVPALDQQVGLQCGLLQEGLTEGSPQAVLTRSSDLWKWRKETTPLLPLSPPLKAASACRSSSVCSNLSARTQMIVLDQVHKLSSLVRLFILMDHVYKPLPATVGPHKGSPDPQLWPQLRAGPFSRAGTGLLPAGVQ